MTGRRLANTRRPRVGLLRLCCRAVADNRPPLEQQQQQQQMYAVQPPNSINNNGVDGGGGMVNGNAGDFAGGTVNGNGGQPPPRASSQQSSYYQPAQQQQQQQQQQRQTPPPPPLQQQQQLPPSVTLTRGQLVRKDVVTRTSGVRLGNTAQLWVDTDEWEVAGGPAAYSHNTFLRSILRHDRGKYAVFFYIGRERLNTDE